MNQTLAKDRWAVITGASSGIGRELAVQLGARGYHLVLVARSADRLAAVQAQLATITRQVRAVPLDLSRPGAADELVALTDRWNIAPEVVVNNAGVGLWGRFLDSEPERVRRLMTLNLESLVVLSQLYGRRMRESGGGYFLQVASTAAFQPVPSFAVYAGTKGMVLQFSRAMHHEGRNAGLSSTALCPGPTATDFFNRAQLAPNWIFRRLMVPASEVAHQGLEAMFRRKAVHVPGLLNKLISLVPRIVPSAWMPTLAALFCQTSRHPPDSLLHRPPPP